MRVLVTGARGFVGRALCARLLADGCHVRAATRLESSGGARAVESTAPAAEWVHIDDLARESWRRAVEGMEAIVHLAARVHVLERVTAGEADAFWRYNVAATQTLARAAATAGVRRLVFLSSVKVHGEQSFDRGFREDDATQPVDAYGASKRDAETALAAVAAETALEFAVLRPPLVYGPGVKANFLRMMQWVDRGVPLPLASVNNRRSLVYVGNLVDAIVKCLEHPAAASETFLIDDGDPVSTAQLLREIGVALDRPARLLPMPPGLLRVAATLVGRGDDAARLLGNLVVDGSHLRHKLEWKPPFTRQEGLAATAAWFRAGPR